MNTPATERGKRSGRRGPEGSGGQAGEVGRKGASRLRGTERQHSDECRFVSAHGGREVEMRMDKPRALCPHNETALNRDGA